MSADTPLLPEGRTKQDVANLVDLAVSDSLMLVGDDDCRYDYDILVASKVARNLLNEFVRRQLIARAALAQETTNG